MAVTKALPSRAEEDASGIEQLELRSALKSHEKVAGVSGSAPDQIDTDNSMILLARSQQRQVPERVPRRHPWGLSHYRRGALRTSIRLNVSMKGWRAIGAPANGHPPGEVDPRLFDARENTKRCARFSGCSRHNEW
jgi:hypothetical protein